MLLKYLLNRQNHLNLMYLKYPMFLKYVKVLKNLLNLNFLKNLMYHLYLMFLKSDSILKNLLNHLNLMFR